MNLDRPERNSIVALADCGSAQEFLLKAAAIELDERISYNDMSELVSEFPNHPNLMRVIADVMLKSDMFNHAVLETEYSLDYWLARTYSTGIRPENYVRYRILVEFADSTPSWGWHNSTRYTDADRAMYDADFAAYLKSCIDIICEAGGGNVPSVINFRKTFGI